MRELKCMRYKLIQSALDDLASLVTASAEFARYNKCFFTLHYFTLQLFYITSERPHTGMHMSLYTSSRTGRGAVGVQKAHP